MKKKVSLWFFATMMALTLMIYYKVKKVNVVYVVYSKKIQMFKTKK